MDCEVAPRWREQFEDYDALYSWSIREPEKFWQSMWRFAEIKSKTMGARTLVNADQMPGAKWFPDARLNYAENLLRRRDDEDAMVFRGEDRVNRRLSFEELYDRVSRLAQALRAKGVQSGDRVAGYMPNMPETIIACLASASIGAVWSSCSPDFGTQGVLDRFGQIAPKVLIAVEGYYYAGKTIDCLPRVKEVTAKLPHLQSVIIVPYTRDDAPLDGIPHAEHYEALIEAQPGGDIDFDAIAPFDERSSGVVAHQLDGREVRQIEIAITVAIVRKHSDPVHPHGADDVIRADREVQPDLVVVVGVFVHPETG